MRSKQALLLITLIASTAPSYAKFEVHEWGTFTSLVGSNGITQTGMYHEDEPLPDFVHGFGELRLEASQPPPFVPPAHIPCHSKACFGQDFFNQNSVTQKMETPVIYFYADQELDVNINVKFPEGVVTETYPGPVKTSPNYGDIKSLANGDTTFSVKVLNTRQGSGPFVPPENIYSHARNVDSNLLRSGAEQEKFIFYRGIGRFQPQVSITSKHGNLALTAHNTALPQAAFLVHVDSQGRGQMLNLMNLVGGQAKFISAKLISTLRNHESNSINSIVSGETARGMLVDSLVKSGLHRDEAFAMVDTWENGYLKVPGLRLLYILPKNEVDQVLPLRLSPAPDQLVRSFVGRIEILLDTEEQKILQDIQAQGTNFNVFSLGRFAEPILHRVAQVYEQQSKVDPQITLQLQQLVDRATQMDTSSGVLQ